MSEKKEIIIPKNVRAEFEVMQNVSLKDLLLFIPSILITIPIFFLPIGVEFKIGILAFTMVIPGSLIIFRPVRENIPAWKHILSTLKFANSQKKYYYKKEGIQHVQSIQEKRKEIPKEVKSRRSSKVVSSTVNSH